MSYKIYVDGREGTTGLKIIERLQNRKDIELLLIDSDKRKDTEERSRLINASDITFLCLPDKASIEAVALVENPNVRIIDASTAHRTADGWCYGFPELSQQQRDQLKIAKRVAVPGCHASGFVTIVYPLVKQCILPTDYPLFCHSLTGYSGGGKKMIAEYEDEARELKYNSPRQYALGQTHKHLPEMQKICGLDYPPVFNPIVADYYSGMAVSIGLHNRLLQSSPTAEQIHAFFAEYYAGQQMIRVMPFQGEGVLTDGMIDAEALTGKDYLQIFVSGNAERTTITSRFDNLGKGASGAAVECMNIMLGLDEGTGLEL